MAVHEKISGRLRPFESARKVLMTRPLQVVVVGAGPVGAVTALAMARKGIAVTVLEADASYDEKPRAATTHASTLEMLADIGIVEEVHRQGLVSPRFQHWDRVTGELVAEFDYARLAGDTPFPYALQCESHKLVKIALDCFSRYPNARVMRNHEVTALEQAADAVTVACRTPGGPATFAADFVVGADGARSLARKSIGAGFDGYTFAERFVGMTTPFDFEAHYGYANRSYFADPERWVAVFKVAGNDMKGLWRVISPATTDEPDEALLSDESLQQRIRHFFPGQAAFDIRYRGVYQFHQRVASSFRAGRVFIAGDAAHVNNPAGGMGMNSGIHDGMELTEILAQVMRDGHDEGLLGRYQRRRRELNIEFVQRDTVLNKRRLEERDAQVRRAHLDELRRTADDPASHKRFLLRASLIESVRKARLIL
jgi:3-(3-hydroxy-phenyl)propionate hydroxylase